MKLETFLSVDRCVIDWYMSIQSCRGSNMQKEVSLENLMRLGDEILY